MHHCIQNVFRFASGRHRISGLVVEYIVAIDVTRARFPADAIIHYNMGRMWIYLFQTVVPLTME